MAFNLNSFVNSFAPKKSAFSSSASQVSLPKPFTSTQTVTPFAAPTTPQMSKAQTSNVGATSTKPVAITTPQKTTQPNPIINTPAAQNYMNTVQAPTTSPTPTNTPTPEEPKTSSAQSAYLKYLTGMFDEKTVGNARKSYEESQKRLADIQTKAEKADTDARRAYEATLDKSGGLKSGAQESATMGRRRSNQELADIALQESAAARSASVAKDTYDSYINAGKSVYEAEQAAEKAKQDSGFSLSEGQTRYELNPDTGQYEQVGTGISKEDTTANEVLSPTEAQALGVPYGTTKSQAYGKTPQKPATEAQNKASMFAVRTDDANKILNQLENTISTMNPVSFGTQSSLEDTTIGNTLVSDDIKQVRQAERNFLNSILRRESGAVISPTEFANGAKQYFPRPGDDKKTLEQKARNRNVAITALKNEAGNSYSTVNQNLSQVNGVFAEEW